MLIAAIPVQGEWVTLGVAICGTITVVVNNWFANRKQAMDLKAHADNSRENIKQEILGEMKSQKSDLSGEIHENTDVSKKAFTEANNFNEKLAKIHDRLQKVEGSIIPGVELRKYLVSIENRLDGIEDKCHKQHGQDI